MKKQIQALITVLLITAISSPVKAATWFQDGLGWKYIKDDGTFYASEWIQDESGK